MWESRLLYPNGNIASYRIGKGVRAYKLTVEKKQHQLFSGVIVNALCYNEETSGPLIVAKQGEWLKIEVENKTDEPTSLHVHGLSKPNEMDGVPSIEPTPNIKPGESFTYVFNAWQAGSFFYHPGNVAQIGKGLVGPLVVLPKQKGQIPDQDVIFFLQEWELKGLKFGEVTPGEYELENFTRMPNFFTINGTCFPDTAPVYTRQGERLRFRFFNKSNDAHSMHIHGHDFKVVNVDGFERKDYYDDTIDVASGQRWEVEVYANNPGTWGINGTKTVHQTNNGVSPGGMISRFIYQND